MKDKRKKTLKNKVIYACRASVSVMLSILLLPILGLIGAMVDHANLNLSRSMVENAGELTVNAALANYDTVVKDVYGLFAMSQDYDDLSNNLQKYFEDSLSAHGLLDESNPYQSDMFNTITEELKDFLGGITVDDINPSAINVNYKNFLGDKMTGSELSNPDVLRNQIVEFMKYRGPAEVGLDLLDSLNVFRDASEKVDVTNAKTELDQASADAADIMQQFYTALTEFDKEVGNVIKAKEKITPAIWKKIRDEHAVKANAAMYMYATMIDLDDEDIYYLAQEDGYYIFNVDRLFKKNDFKSEKKTKNVSKIEQLIEETKLYTLGRAKTSTQDEVIGVTQMLNVVIPQIESAAGKVDQGYLSALITAYNSLMKKTRELTNYGLGLKDEIASHNSVIAGYDKDIENYNGKIDDCEKDIEDNEKDIAAEKKKSKPNQSKIATWEAEIETYEETIESYEAKIEEIEEEKKTEQGKLDTVTALSNRVQSALAEVDSYACRLMKKFDEKYTAKVKGAVDTAQAEMKKIYEYLRPYYEAIEALKNKKSSCSWTSPVTRQNFVEYLIDLGDEAINQIGIVNGKAGVLDTEANKYGKVDAAQEERRQDEYYQLMKSEASAAKSQYNANDVKEVVDQVRYIKSYLYDSSNGVYTQLKKNVYQKDFISKSDFFMKSDVWSDTAIYFMCRSAKKLITGSMTETESFNKYFKVMLNDKVYTEKQYLKKISEANLKYYTDETGTELAKTTVDVPKFYVYLMANYGTVENKKNKEGDNLVKSAKKISEVAQKETTETTTLSDDLKYTVFDGLSKKGTGGDGKAADAVAKGFKVEEGTIGGILTQFRSMTNLAKGLFGTLTKGLENARDNLLITTYLFENFSYATIEAEPKQKGEEPELKTLTNVDINKDNNVLYGCELEYILYGYRGSVTTSGILFWKKTKETGPSDNIKIVQGNIFSIRFLMNSLFAITDKQLNAQTLPPAMAIQAATAGFFPYKVAQIVLDVCLALTESIMDVDDLMAGKEVPLMKTYATWTCSINGMINNVKEKVVEEASLAAKRAAKDGYEALKNGLQELVSSGVEELSEKASEYAEKAVDNLTASIATKTEEIIASASQAILNAAGETFTELFTSTSTFSTAEIEQKITDKVMGVLEGSSFGTPVKEFLEGKNGNPGFIDKMIDYVLNTKVVATKDSSAVIKRLNGKSVVSLLEEYHLDIKKSGKTISVTNTMYTDLVEMVQAMANEFIKNRGDELKAAINGWIGDTGAKVGAYADDIIQKFADENEEKVVSVAQEKIDEIKNEVNKKLDDLFPPRGTGELNMGKGSGSTEKTGVLDNSVVSTILSFTYMDYLRLFIFLGLSGDDADNIMKRTAEVMELNIRNGLKDYYDSPNAPAEHPADDFSMSRAFTYVTLNSSIQVKPLLMSNKLFRRTDKNQTVVDYWTYDYKTLGGY